MNRAKGPQQRTVQVKRTNETSRTDKFMTKLRGALGLLINMCSQLIKGGLHKIWLCHEIVSCVRHVYEFLLGKYKTACKMLKMKWKK